MKKCEMTAYEMKAGVVKALAHPLRLAVVEFLRDRERCVCEIADHLGAGQSNVSRHLSLMVNACVLSNRKDGMKVFYALRTPCVLKFLSCVDSVLKERLRTETALLRAR